LENGNEQLVCKEVLVGMGKQQERSLVLHMKQLRNLALVVAKLVGKLAHLEVGIEVGKLVHTVVGT
jgi:hypothetical protein